MTDPFRLAEWAALPDCCAISGCDTADADQRGPVFLHGGTMFKVCPEHWEAIHLVLGEQATWGTPGRQSTGRAVVTDFDQSYLRGVNDALAEVRRRLIVASKLGERPSEYGMQRILDETANRLQGELISPEES